MVDKGYVEGSEEQAKPLVIGKDIVYVHKDIKKVPKTDYEGNTYETYVYHETQYKKDEYLQLMAEQNAELNELINTILGVSE